MEGIDLDLVRDRLWAALNDKDAGKVIAEVHLLTDGDEATETERLARCLRTRYGLSLTASSLHQLSTPVARGILARLLRGMFGRSATPQDIRDASAFLATLPADAHFYSTYRYAPSSSAVEFTATGNFLFSHSEEGLLVVAGPSIILLWVVDED